MRVHTDQGYNLREFRGRIDLGRGTYRDEPLIVEAQRKLYGILQEDQVVWCVQTPPILAGAVGRYLHEVEVDHRDILAIIDTLVWCHIVGYGRRYIPHVDWAEPEFQAMTRGEVWDEAARQRAEDEYLAKNLPADRWSALTKSEITKKSDQVLLRFPFAHSTIVNVRVISEEMASGHSKCRGRRRKRVP
ncbi:MAG TPA: hypothetical protein VMP01_03940 [Pirellulaceae bacterium]|nr:hypothetical protein [Pirellulaceae bacterium]